MDEDLQQFRDEDKFNPMTFWIILAIVAFACALLGGKCIPAPIPWWYALIVCALLGSVIMMVLTSFTCAPGVAIPTRTIERGRYFTLKDGELRQADAKRWAPEEAEEALLYLFDKMEIETFFIDDKCIERVVSFRVRFQGDSEPTISQYIAFYRWYQGLLAAMPNADAVLDLMNKQAAMDAPIFRIEWPLNPTIPALNS